MAHGIEEFSKPIQFHPTDHKLNSSNGLMRAAQHYYKPAFTTTKGASKHACQCLLVESAVACRLSCVAGIVRPWKMGELVDLRKQPQCLSLADAAWGQVKIP